MLRRIESAREAEKQAKARYMDRWRITESVPYRLTTAHAIKSALEAGVTRKAILHALGTSNYGTVGEYLRLVDEPEAYQREDEKVRLTEDGAEIDGHAFVRDGEGNWEPVDKDSEEAWTLLQQLPQ